MEKVSAVVTIYNWAQYLPEALNCLLAQTHPLHEIIVVDDASTDNSAEVAESIFREALKGPPEKRISPVPEMHLVIHEDNLGLPVARNTGITWTTGDYVLILDADDRLDLQFTAKCMELLRSNSELSGAYTWQKWFGTPEFSLGQVYKNPPWDFRMLPHSNFMNDCSLYKRQVWEDVRDSNGYGYDPDMWGWCGWEFYIHAGKLGHQWGLIQEPLYWWRRGHTQGDQPTLGGRAWGKREELMAQIKAKHPELYQ